MKKIIKRFQLNEMEIGVFLVNDNRSSLESLRLNYLPRLPNSLKDPQNLIFTPHEILKSSPEIAALFPKLSHLPFLKATEQERKASKNLRIGVVFSGGPAPGGHNVIAGIFDAIKKIAVNGQLIGFLDGPSGIILGKHKELSLEEINNHRNLGGFDLLGSGRTKIETEEQMYSALSVCETLTLDGLIIIGGDDSNTNAAVLAQFFKDHESSISVVGVPKTIDGDLKNSFVPLSFGFDTASRVYAEMISNICREAMSSKKYTHFIKLMGRSASHVTLECALATHPNFTFIGEEVLEKKKTLSQIVSDLCDLIIERSKRGKSYGVILIPEGLIQFIPEVSTLIEELNKSLATEDPSSAVLIARLSESSRKCFNTIPENIQKQLLLGRDPHGNVQVSLIETEKLLAELVGKELEKRKEQKLFTGAFHPITHFFGYEGRAAFPSNFDANYCYALGHIAALLIRFEMSGYMTAISNLQADPSDWDIGAVPITSLMHMEIRKGKAKPVIEKALVDLKSPAFSYFSQNKESWALEDSYRFPGPMQFSENSAVKDSLPLSTFMDISLKDSKHEK